MSSNIVTFLVFFFYLAFFAIVSPARRVLLDSKNIAASSLMVVATSPMYVILRGILALAWTCHPLPSVTLNCRMTLELRTWWTG